MCSSDLLQSTIEELETANEQLQSSNEELITANEELQSTNEELSSLNEELHSVNAEHFRQNDDLLRLARDFDALLHATQIGVIFFDEAMRIRRFTRAIGEIFRFTDTDIGRPLSTFRSPFGDFDLEAFLQRVLRVDAPEEMEVRDAHGRSWLLRAARYPDDKGVVLSIISVGARARSANDAGDTLLARAEPYAGDPVIVADPVTGRIEYANAAAMLRLRVNESTLEQKLQASRLTPEWSDGVWTSWLSTIPFGESNARLDVSMADAKGEAFTADLRASVVDAGYGRRAVVRIIENRGGPVQLRDSSERSRVYALSNRELEKFATVVAHDLRAPLRHLNQFAGFLADELGESASAGVADCLAII